MSKTPKKAGRKSRGVEKTPKLADQIQEVIEEAGNSVTGARPKSSRKIISPIKYDAYETQLPKTPKKITEIQNNENLTKTPHSLRNKTKAGIYNFFLNITN